MIKDSGNRTEFESGAVRDMREGKGRCDLLPLDVLALHMADPVLDCISKFLDDCPNVNYLWEAIEAFHDDKYINGFDMNPHAKHDYWQCMANTMLEVAIHFEEGAKKYGENNWRKGIPVYCYIDSAVRHYLKWRRGDKDEPHNRAFVWNLLCCIWTITNKPEREEVDKNG